LTVDPKPRTLNPSPAAVLGVFLHPGRRPRTPSVPRRRHAARRAALRPRLSVVCGDPSSRRRRPLHAVSDAHVHARLPGSDQVWSMPIHP